jgi:RraA family protein
MDVAAIRERLLALDTACITDADRQVRVMDAGLRPMRPGLKLIGRARTARCRDDFLTVMYALREAEPGEVLVVDGSGGHRALAGELFATEAHRKGLAGLVIDGACRDVRTLRGLDLPVYARWITPLAGTRATRLATQVAVVCGGVTVNPGDIVFGDDDGVVVASRDELARIIPLAEGIQRNEARILARLAEGASLFDELTLG